MNAITRNNIWHYEQNKPTLVVNDITERYPEVDPDFVYEVLLKRGVFKWLAVRRMLIKLKDKWKGQINRLQARKNPKEKGFLAALEQCRKEVRSLCHSDRWQAPDIDKKAQEYLNELLG